MREQIFFRAYDKQQVAAVFAALHIGEIKNVRFLRQIPQLAETLDHAVLDADLEYGPAHAANTVRILTYEHGDHVGTGRQHVDIKRYAGLHGDKSIIPDSKDKAAGSLR